jgi:glutaredoxin 3
VGRRTADASEKTITGPSRSFLRHSPDAEAWRRRRRITIFDIHLVRIEELMAKVEIYSTMFCPYCARAKGLLAAKKVAFEEIDLLETPGRRAEMLERSGGRQTVPQIFIDGEHIGGCDDLLALERAGQLDPKLAVGA